MKLQKTRKRFLQQKQLSLQEEEIIEKDFKGKDYAYYKSIKDEDILLSGQYSADATYCKISQSVRPDASRLPILKYAATVALLIAVTFGIYHFNKPEKYLVASTSYGERMQINLPDGSMVTLNSLSSVSYPENIDKGRTREIQLNGEAFFDVAKNEKSPFVVKASKVKITVLGTKFNISAYGNDENITTNLYEGAVAITSDNNDSLQLNPGEQAVYNKKTKKVEVLPFDNQNDNAWISGSIHFENIALKNIFKILEREKDITFNISNGINMELKLTAKFNNNESVEEILEYLSQPGGFTFEKKEQKYTINKK